MPDTLTARLRRWGQPDGVEAAAVIEELVAACRELMVFAAVTAEFTAGADWQIDLMERLTAAGVSIGYVARARAAVARAEG